MRHKYAYGQNLYIYENGQARPRAYLISGEGEVAIDSYRAGKITLLVTAETPATLFLSEANYPGWKFVIDGGVTKYPRPQAIFCATELAAGTHRVEFVYDPWSLKIGAVISGLTVLLLTGLLFFGKTKDRRLKTKDRRLKTEDYVQ